MVISVFFSLISLTAGCGGGGSTSSSTSNNASNSSASSSTFNNNTTGTISSTGGPIGSSTPGTLATGDTVTVTGSKTLTYNELNIGGGNYYYNPSIAAGYYSSTSKTIISMIQDGTECALNVVIPVTTTGTFTVGVNGVSVAYNDLYNYAGYFTATSGTVTITSFGAVGQLVQGTFDVTAVNNSTGSSTYHLTGSFKATRVADQ